MNGNIVGGFNIPTRKTANGVWNVNEVANYTKQDMWPVTQDPLFSQVSLLCHALPVLNAQNPVDMGSLAGWDAKWAAQASAGTSGRIAQCSTPPFPATPYMYNTVSTVSSINFTRSIPYVLGTLDFTIEFWAVFTTFGSSNIFDMRTSPSSVHPTFDVTGSGKILYLVSALTKITSSATLSGNVPYHIAYTRSGGNLGTLWINGASNGTWVDSSNYAGNTSIYWMGSLFGAAQSPAFYDELRITSGTQGAGACRYTTAFTPPTARFPDN